MIGIAFCLGFCSLSRKSWQKGLWLAIAALLFGTMALTNSRTSILMTCALAGGFAFFAILRKGSWKRFLAGAAAALVLMAALFLISGKVFDAHNQRLAQLRSVSAEAPAESPAEVPVETSTEVTAVVPPSAETITAAPQEPTTREPSAVQGSFLEDLRNLNGRVLVWRAAGEALRNDPRLLIWGTDYSGMQITMYHPQGADLAHAHNSWIEILLCLGLPGLAVALVCTLLALWNIAVLLLKRECTLWQKTTALLMICLLGAGFLEPYLFFADRYYHYTDFLFFLCLGYSCHYARQTD